MTWLAIAGCNAPAITVADAAGDHDEDGGASPTEEVPDRIPGETGEEAAPDSGGSGEGGERLFVDGVIHQVEIRLDRGNSDPLWRGTFQWVDATLLVGGESWPVALRLKGSSTLDTLSGKPSLKVDADRHDPGADVWGHKKFNLHAGIIDPSSISEVMSYGFMREVGLPASRTAFAHVVIDERDYGLYNIVESTSREYLRTWFGTDFGNVYENGYQDCEVTQLSCFDKEQWDEGNDDAFKALAAAADEEGEAWDAAIPPMFDWDRFIGSLAFEALIAHWDNYAYDLSNYRLFHEPVSGKFTFLPWSTDLDFGFRPWSYPDCGRYGVELSDYDDGILALRCEQSPSCHRDVVDRMELLVDQWETLDPVGRVDDLSDFVRDAVYDDPRRYYSTRDFEEHVECVRAWVAQRPGEARAWVAAERAAAGD